MQAPYTHKSKVFAYIIRQNQGQTQLLIFAHRDYPSAGLQVPAGTVEEGEDLIAAVKREVQEESGLDNFGEIAFLGKQDFIHEDRRELHHRSFFVLPFVGESPNTFQFEVEGSGSDKGLVFNYSWVDLEKVPKLIGDHDILFPSLHKYLSKNP